MSFFSKLFKFLGDPTNLLSTGNFLSNLILGRKQLKLAEQANTMNYEAQKRANDTNIMLTRETNAHQMALAEKEYQRSLPTTQVANYMQAGMSRAGALGALSGAGTYNAPALNTAQVSPEMQDPTSQIQALSGMMNMFANAQQMNQETKLRRIEIQEKQREINYQKQYDELSPRITKLISLFLKQTNRPTYQVFIDSLYSGYTDGKGNIYGYRDAQLLQRAIGNPLIRDMIKQQIEESYRSQNSYLDSKIKSMATQLQELRFPFEYERAPKEAEQANKIIDYLLGNSESGKPRYLDLYDKEYSAKILQLEETIEDLEKRYNEVDLSEEQRKWLFLVRSLVGALKGNP